MCVRAHAHTHTQIQGVAVINRLTTNIPKKKKKNCVCGEILITKESKTHYASKKKKSKTN